MLPLIWSLLLAPAWAASTDVQLPPGQRAEDWRQALQSSSRKADGDPCAASSWRNSRNAAATTARDAGSIEAATAV